MALPNSHPPPFGDPGHGQTRRLSLVASELAYARASVIPVGHQNPSCRAASHQGRSNRTCRLHPGGLLQRRYARQILRTLQLPGSVARGHTDPDRRPRSASAHAFAVFLPVLQLGPSINPAPCKSRFRYAELPERVRPSSDVMIAEPAAFLEVGPGLCPATNPDIKPTLSDRT